ncbi:probable inactive purple acid phosphatase 28 isoform X2 [Dioscorea cayenensis subsp. rotundata]|uniref:Probable inactive purple acid phosphatase 28 isoform X2 n=1 Tax=Dioscorea cayennensis subsp. rotundata TaxID=55577 RepID=A0AB40BU57_DIOCR|nr:probable inactive purple acid phosphatase 28 isoform X2 [Dioscorea cayenensis subsp. rotundata]
MMTAHPWRPYVLLVLAISIPLLLFESLFSHLIFVNRARPRIKRFAELPLRFRYDGTFKILQVADMHFGNGKATRCKDVLDSEFEWCSDLNTTRFLRRMIEAERPDLIAFTGDNIFGPSATDAAESLFRAFAPAMESMIPWAAILGNHDQESSMNREELMSLVSLMDYSVSQVNPPSAGGTMRIEGFGNYHIKVHGAPGSGLDNTSILNLYFLDSGDRVVVSGRKTYGWIRESQLNWVHSISQQSQVESQSLSPALAFFHIPIPEVRDLWFKKIKGTFQEYVACSFVNSGVLNTLVSMRDVKAVFFGHDHLNDFCGELNHISVCYGGGFGYHAYGRAGWPRRARVIKAELRKGSKTWMGIQNILTWKRIDDERLTKIDDQVLWSHADDEEEDSSHSQKDV